MNRYLRETRPNFILKFVFWKPILQFFSLGGCLRQRKWEDLVTNNYQCFPSMGCSSQCRSKGLVEKWRSPRNIKYLWRSGGVPEIWNICGEVEKVRIPPGIFPPTWRSSAPLSAASQFWPTDEKLRNENLVQGSGLELFVLKVLYCLIVSSPPLFIGPESNHCLAFSLTC